MTVTTTTPGGGVPVPPEDLVTVTVDGIALSVPKGTLVIRAAELLGIEIPRFCDHPLLEPVGACRQCLVEVEGQRKPMASCTTTVTDGMVVRTQLTSPVAKKAQEGVVEMLLINHPLDCPICDKGGECPLQNQSMEHGRASSRFTGTKRTFPKPIPITNAVLLDRERCVSCARCTRFAEQIAGDPFIALIERGAEQQVGVGIGEDRNESYFSGNTVQICPVGALTGTAYRFRSRPFDLVSSPSVCEHCASGCAQRTDHRRGKVLRRLAGDDPEVNEEWNCDKGRWAFAYATEPDRITAPLVRRDGVLAPASWPEALSVAAEGLAGARGRAGVLTGGRVTLEDAYAYAKFARLALGTNDIDFRARPHTAEEADVLAAHVAGTFVSGGGVSYAALEGAPVVLLAGFEPEEESPIVFLRLRKAVRKHGLKVAAIGPFTSSGLHKLAATLLAAAPGTERRILDALAEGSPDSGLDDDGQAVAEALRRPGAVILAGERLALAPGALTAAVALAGATGARLAWIPRRAGERGALEAGALPNLLPGGRPIADLDARRQVSDVWGGSALPGAYGRDAAGIVDAARSGRIGALLVGGVEPADLPDPVAALAALDAVPFLVSLEIRRSAVTERADVVFPVAAVAEKAGSFINWEGRIRPFAAALRPAPGEPLGGLLPDLRVLDRIADEMDLPLALPDVDAARRELAALGPWHGGRPDVPPLPEQPLPSPGPGQAVLATWRMLLDDGRLQDGEPYLAGTAHAPVVRLSAGTAASAGLVEGDPVTVAGPRGSVTFPLEVSDLPDRVVWLPANSAGGTDAGGGVLTSLGALSGDVVRITASDSAAPGRQEDLSRQEDPGHGEEGAPA